MALLTVPDAGHGIGTRLAQSDPRAANRTHRPDRLCRRRRALLPHAPLLRACGVQESHRIHEAQRKREGRRMETGIRVLLLTAVLMTLPGCASVQNWFHHRSEVRQAKAEAKEEAAQQEAQDAAQDADATPPRVVDPEVERRKIKV